MEHSEDLPESGAGGECLDCRVALYFAHSGAPNGDHCLICRKCGRRYLFGAPKWTPFDQPKK